MENNFAEIKVSHGDTSKIMIYQIGVPFDVFKIDIIREFHLPFNQIILYDVERNAEITHPVSLRDGKAFQIQEGSDLNEFQSKRVEEEISKDTNIISFATLPDKTFHDESILEEVNKWALSMNFQVIVSEGLKKMNKSWKKSFRCHIRSCPYRLIFLSDENCENFKVYEKLSQKYQSHSKFYFL